jgi:hypothetical protein
MHGAVNIIAAVGIIVKIVMQNAAKELSYV